MKGIEYAYAFFYPFHFSEEVEMLESKYQAHIIKRLEILFPGCVVIKNDPNYIQGIPDLLVLFQSFWAALEVKVSATARKRPNQEYFIDRLGRMSFAAFIYPENEEEVLYELQQAFGTDR